MNIHNRQRMTLTAFVIAVSLAFVWVIRPYIGVIFWGIVLAIVFAPLNERFQGDKKRHLAKNLSR